MKWIFLISMFLAACSTTPNRAPIVEQHPKPPKAPSAQLAKDWRPQVYTVKKGDTLFGIALEFGLDYKDLANWNGVANIDKITTGTELKLYPPREQAVTRPLDVTPAPAAATFPLKSGASETAQTIPPGCTTCTNPNPNTNGMKSQPLALELPYSDQALQKLQPSAPPQSGNVQQPPQTQKPVPVTLPVTQNPQDQDVDGIDWGWPANGKIVSGFSESAHLKGIDITGKMGQPILASASGKVVYTGSSLRGYGKLVIIKHNKTYLSAYAHNSKILVTEGQNVKRGEEIGEMGDTDSSQVMLHFEIRRFGKPVDPMNYLKPNDQGAHR